MKKPFFFFTAIIAATSMFWSCNAAPVADATKGNDATLHRQSVYETSVSKTGIFGDKKISYTAALETIEIQKNSKELGAKLVTISYVAENETAKTERPVLFVFNGGPISSSIPLHIGATGPYRVAFDDDISINVENAKLIENTYSPLAVADLVYFDPASTGLSKVSEGIDPLVYTSLEADAQQFVDFATTWLQLHNREQAPIFIVGESFGTMRAALAAGMLTTQHPDIQLEGVMLMGQAVNIIEYAQRKQNIISYVASLPTLAAAAWDLDVADKANYTFESFINEATSFADSEYLAALYKGNLLSANEVQSISAKLEKYTGIPAQFYVDNNIRITKQQYRSELFKDKKLLLGNSDIRYSRSIDEEGPADPSRVIYERYIKAFTSYFQDVFGFPLPDSYVNGEYFGGLPSWDWIDVSPFGAYAYGDHLNPAFEANPEFRLVISNGYHDAQTTVGGARYAAMQSDWPKDRVKLSFYRGGHMAYSIENSAKLFCEDLKTLITGEQSNLDETL
ncbi:S10 family peptidase [Hirschia baltica]|uniref:Peptidase S10 serine carboxypeptidase n=1 Tax=Hirschia baltica (strain ATCC 49814 / DSM 5838 / IFAM 1418) TaxID=582402 RepID=C6XPT0_HIRBI|nr:peptidase S10 serine carboxypeptidase [Hirschia baltica]ACT60345.1 peptidase S10 serine carboxypeptidase [Hirschia baltica ATCC 49814]